MILHIHHKAPTHNTLESCARILTLDSEVLLIQDAVLNLLTPGALEPFSAIKVYALKQDCEARGITAKIPDSITLVDMEGFVELTESNLKIVDWN